VATAEEGILLNKILPKNRKIYILNGYDKNYKKAFIDFSLIPVLNSPSNLTSFIENNKSNSACIQIDIGMRRLGFRTDELFQYKEIINKLNLDLILGHLTTAIKPKNIANEKQLNKFKKAIINFPTVRKSLAASHGIFINNNYHFDITRPGVALFGGIKDRNILNVVNIELPVLQTHFLNVDEGIGYGLTYFSKEKKRVATLAGGYADGLTRNFSNIGFLYHKKIPCPILGRISMDLVTVDITHLKEEPKKLTFIGTEQTINDLSDIANTISHEILINLGNRYSKKYLN
jgi:alanine racemase|tara:strand:- start:1236 stop:2102 length:867 start_codon:yes stop_codon:yes gene_type:complete